MRPKGSAAELERRRMRAVELVEQGESPAVVARILGVARPSVYRWRQLAASGPDGLAAKPHPGPVPRLSGAQLAELEGLLLLGATAHGWPNELWTAARGTVLIQRNCGVRFHSEHVGRILRDRLNWSCQRPQRQHPDGSDAAIAPWVAEEFPRILSEAAAREAHLAFVDETGFMLNPLVRRTFAPRGRTPGNRYTPPDLEALRATLTKELDRLRQEEGLLRSFIRHSKLPLGVSEVGAPCHLRTDRFPGQCGQPADPRRSAG